uniref:Protein regulator of cytokinesis 1 n=1 Tax=Rhabditophanes sp. KR3021 TaxID=114890 RepID=A0AC35TR41_9BILA
MNRTSSSSTGSKRLSMIDTTNGLMNHFNSSLCRLNDMWDQISMSDEMRVERVSTFYETINKVINMMVQEETANFENVAKDCAAFSMEVQILRNELGLEPFDVMHLPSKSIAICRALKKEKERLEEEKIVWLNRIRKCKDECKQLCTKLDNEYALINVSEKKINISEQNDLLEYLNSLYKELEDVSNKFKKITNQIREYLRIMGESPEGDLRDLLYSDIEDENYIFSNDKHELLKYNLNEVKIRYELWQLEKKAEYSEAYERLEQLWDKCGVPELERFLPESYNPEVSSNIGEEIQLYEEMYLRNASLYDAYYEWLKEWNAKLEIERALANPETFQMRSKFEGIMVNEKKVTTLESLLELQKNNQKRVNMLFSTIKEEQDASIKIQGIPILEHVKKMIEDYKNEKEELKKLKSELKKEILKHESVYGSSPRPKLNLNRTVYSGTSPIPRASLFGSQDISMITPLRKTIKRPIKEMKTSSPKHFRSINNTLSSRSP